jgi:outer membrane protein assembly factor BamB
VACIGGDHALALDLARRGGWLVIALEPDAARALALRQAGEAAGVLGRGLEVHEGSAERIPTADRLVDLLALPAMGQADVQPTLRAEIARVLTPLHGRCVFKDGEIAQPALDGADWWTHKLHGPDNNAVSRDTVFRFPPLTQFRAMPMYTAGMGASHTADGIHFELNDWAFNKPVNVGLAGRILARSVANGRILWEATMPEEVLPSAPVSLYADGALCVAGTVDDWPAIIRYDGRTGQPRPPVLLGEAGLRVKWLAHAGGRFHALLGAKAELKPRWSWFLPAPKGQWEGQTLFGSRLIACDAATGATLWTHQEAASIDFRTIAVADGRLYAYVDNTRLAAFDAATGTLVWENRDQSWIGKLVRPPKPHVVYVANTPSLIAADGFLRLAVAECKEGMQIFAAADGKFLNTVRGATPKTVLVDGTLMSGNNAMNPTTGAKLEQPPWSPAGTAWCGLVSHAPGTGVLGHSTLNFKSACAVGAWVAGGTLLYSPTICDCGAVTGAAGFVSAGTTISAALAGNDHPLVQGPAWGRALTAETGATDWPAHRGFTRRGSTAATVSEQAQVRWTITPKVPFVTNAIHNQRGIAFDERPTPPIIAAGRVFRAGSDGILRAHALATGALEWTVHLDGPVMTPPAYAGGRLFVPGCDGWLYALDASTGELAWKRRLAPAERRIVFFDQWMSTWPVLSVAVRDGIVYAAAGWMPTDGTVAFALDAATGAVRWRHADEPATKTFQGSHNPPDRPIQGLGGHLVVVGDRLWGAGSWTPPLVLDRKDGNDPLFALKERMLGKAAYYDGKKLVHVRGQDVVPLADGIVLVGGGDLFDEPQLREGKVGRTAYQAFFTNPAGDWQLEQAPADAFLSRIAPAVDDDLLVFAATPSTAEKKGEEVEVRGAPLVSHGLNTWSTTTFVSEAKRLQQRPVIKDGPSRIGLSLESRGAFGRLSFAKASWRSTDLDCNALALTRQAVLVAHAVGTTDLYAYQFDADTSRKPLVTYAGWRLSALARDGGRELWAIDLPSEPLQNGLAVAGDGTIVVVLRDGTVLGVGKTP